MAGTKLEVCRKSGGALGSADCDDLIFDRLKHDFQNADTEFGNFLDEKHAVVRETVGV